MARKKKKKHDDEHVDESWLIPYADLLTLLLALFIVLFAMSSVDAAKFQMLSKSFNAVFTGGTGVLEYSSVTPPENEKDGVDQLKKDKEKDKEQKKKEREAADRQELEGVQKQVNQFIKNKKLETQLETKLTKEGLLITIKDSIFFDSGRADIRQEDIPLAKEISNLLVLNPPRNIIISGHTDNVPIKNSQYQSNWHLSVMRAVNFMAILTENPKLDAKVFSAKGFGEYKPAVSNKTAEGRSKNRRVEVLIQPRNAATDQNQ
ncbi:MULTISPECIES: flagellar motor protein MotB [Bacillus]|uniref:flagellar motor protein MotB n=1 Tax=Bacillus TaxID=1386 RepID=UPI000A17AA53|nr:MULTISPECIES: flagellar motor protein MotB [Bacillus amyloliquefaciens group]ARJ74715.1 flagellar motor protein MotB [Bacillus velezensis]MBO3650074.1 flagellar motor protein MotB [Bacillus amyloliquefaciens]MCJ2174606.1 flagellar motor protein MotB [Bacillus amyloliquefaciens]MCP1533977.1 chemotaxis protein MotB [Bacillus velezensis]MCR4348364.1 flagellar motor protein MotB [Bacillus amyloliquefaciens]